MLEELGFPPDLYRSEHDNGDLQKTEAHSLAFDEGF